MLYLLLIPVLVYAGLVAAMFLLQDWLVFPRFVIGPAPDVTPAAEGFERLWLDLESGGRVEGWYFRAPGASVERPGPAVIYLHGNAELIDHQGAVVGMYRRMGVSVLLPEYRGYGRSDGSPGEAAIRADMRRFYDGLAARPEVDPGRIVIHGRSIGGGVGANLALDRPHAALILDTPFVSVASMAGRYLMPAFLVRHPFRVDRAVASLETPLMINGACDDEILPVEQARRLRAVAPRAVYNEAACGHNTFPGDFPGYAGGVESFLGESGVLSGEAITPPSPGPRP